MRSFGTGDASVLDRVLRPSTTVSQSNLENNRFEVGSEKKGVSRSPYSRSHHDRAGVTAIRCLKNWLPRAVALFGNLTEFK